jgi:hypothetical protein
MYILVHLDVSVRGEVVGVGQPLQLGVDLGVAGGGAGDVQRGGGRRVVHRFDFDGFRRLRGLGHRVAHAQTLPRSPGVPSIAMATIEECRAALEKLSDNMQHAEGDVAAATALDRSVSCRITDLDITFVGRMTGGRIVVQDTLQGSPKEKAQIRLTMKGDDLVALVNGELNFAKAWGSGRVKLEAGLRDLFQLRKLL